MRVTNDLGDLYERQGRYDQASAFYQQALAIRRKALGTHNTVATTLTLVGDFYAAHGQPAKAVPLYREAVAMREMVLGKDHPAVATSLIGLAKLCISMGDQDQAERYYQRALFIFGSTFGPENPHVAKTLPQTFSQAGFQGRLLRAGSVEQQARLQIAESLKTRGIVYVKLGRDHEAELAFAQSLKEYEKALGPSDPALEDLLKQYVALLRKMGATAQVKSLEARLQSLQLQH